MHSLAKAGFAAALRFSGLHTLLGRRPRRLPLILGYHRVVEKLAGAEAQTLPGMAVSQRSLRAQLEWVARHFRVVSVDELGTRLERGDDCGKLAAVTFDDGYRDVYDYGLPVLDRMGLPAAVFVVSGLIGAKVPPLHDRLYQVVAEAVQSERPLPELFAHWLARDYALNQHPALETVRNLLAAAPAAELQENLDALSRDRSWHRPPDVLTPLDWDALARMQQAGITIGSHTQHHALLSFEEDDSLRDELERSRHELEAGLATKVRHFAYPDGRFSRRVVRAVAAAGYRFAYTICAHRDPAYPLFTIPRVMLWEGSCRGAFGGFSPSLLDCHASGVLPLHPSCCGNHVDSMRLLAC